MDFVRPVEAIIPGAQGRVLAVLAETTAELNIRTIADLAGVSQAHASRVLPRLVDLGLVERREVPPASLFRLVPQNIGAQAILQLARSTERALDDIGHLAAAISPQPDAVIVFGSLARHEAGIDSDVDLVVVRSAHVDEDDDTWAESLERWRGEVARLTGNAVQVLEVGADEVSRHVERSSELWAAISRDGRVVCGSTLDVLAAGARD